MRPLFITCALLTSIALLSDIASAQFGGGGRGTTGAGGGGGLGSTSAFGGSSGMGSGGGTGGFGSSGFGQAGMSSGGMGSGGMGSGGMGGGGLGGGQQGMGMGGQQGGGSFIGGNNPSQFLGGNAQGGQQNGRGGNAMGMNGMGGQFGNANRGGGNRNNLNLMNSMFGNNGGNSMSNNAAPIRPRQRVAFEYQVPTSELLNVNLQTQLKQVSVRKPGLTNVLLSMNPGGEVVLRGVVKSEADARLAQNLVRLEPGVRSVRNELTFPNSASDGEPK